MIKLRLADVEAARLDPSQYRGGSPAGAGRGLSMMRALQYAVYIYHKRGNNLDSAISHLEAMFHRNFKNATRLPSLIDQLAEYHTQFQSLPNVVVEPGIRIVIPVDQDFQLTGEIGRLDIAPGGGYAVWLLAGVSFPWQYELRMPIMQGHFAYQMMVKTDQVTVGFYFFDRGQHEAIQYAPIQVATAFQEARALGAALA